MVRADTNAALARQFGRRLRALRYRVRPRLTSTGLAVRAGISKAYLSEIEAGEAVPSGLVVFKLATALGREPWELWVFDADDPAATLLDAGRRRDWKAFDAAFAAFKRSAGKKK